MAAQTPPKLQQAVDGKHVVDVGYPVPTNDGGKGAQEKGTADDEIAVKSRCGPCCSTPQRKKGCIIITVAVAAAVAIAVALIVYFAVFAEKDNKVTLNVRWAVAVTPCPMSMMVSSPVCAAERQQ